MEETNLIKEYVNQLETVICNLPIYEIHKIAKILIRAYENGNLIFTMGNGGHSSTASHFVNDLLKHTIVSNDKNKIAITRKRIKAISLNESMPTITAWANDISYEVCFSEQLINWIERDDIVIGFSASGNSKNIIKAFEIAKLHKSISIGFIGKNGGKMKDIADFSLQVPSNNDLYIEDAHLIITHIITNFIRTIIQKRDL